jgi:hypothetical protein
VSKDSILTYKEDGKKINGALIKCLKNIKDVNGDPNLYLTKKGDDNDDDDEKHIKRFKSNTSSLIEAIKWITEHTDFITKIDADEVDELTASLEDLRKLMNPSASTDTEE